MHVDSHSAVAGQVGRHQYIPPPTPTWATPSQSQRPTAVTVQLLLLRPLFLRVYSPPLWVGQPLTRRSGVTHPQDLLQMQTVAHPSQWQQLNPTHRHRVGGVGVRGGRRLLLWPPRASASHAPPSCSSPGRGIFFFLLDHGRAPLRSDGGGLTTAKLKQQLPSKIAVTIFRRLTETERIEGTKEVMVRRPLDEYLLLGAHAKALFGLGPTEAGDVDVDVGEKPPQKNREGRDEVPSEWEVYVSAKSASRIHPPGTTLLLRYPLPPPRAPPAAGAAGSRAKRQRRAGKMLAPSQSGEGSPDVFFGGQGLAHSMVTWRDKYLFATGHHINFNAVVVFDLQTGAFIQALQSAAYVVVFSFFIFFLGCMHPPLG